MNISVRLYKPQPYQMAVHNGLAEHWEHSIHVVKAVRQCGKSMMAVNILLKASLEHPNQTSILMSPTLGQARKVYKDIKKACKDSPLITESNSTLLEITFLSGSEIKLISAEQGDSIRGNTCSKYGILVVDEAAYIKDEVFYEATNFVNANKAPILCLSTPRFKSGFFYDFFKDAELKKDGVFAYDFTEYPNPYLTPERLEYFRTKMPVNLFRADYLGQWMEATSDLFGDFSSIVSNSYDETSQLVGGIDWGVGQGASNTDSDSTSFALMNKKGQMVALCNWNDLSATDTIKRLCDTIQERRVERVAVETNSIGAVYLELLKNELRSRRSNCIIHQFTTTNESKRKIIEGLIVDIQNQAITIVDSPILKTQLSAYKMEKTKGGKGITYNASSGYHDDAIIALALANYQRKKQGSMGWI